MFVRSGGDSWVWQQRPNANRARAAYLHLQGAGGGNDRRAFIHFRRPFPQGATVLSAKLRVYLRGSWSGSQTITAQRIVGRWRENTITWNVVPATTSANQVAVAANAGVDRQEVEFDLTAMLQAVADGGAWYGVRLHLNADVLRRLYASEHPRAELHPELEVEFVLPPFGPDDLTPSGGGVVSSASPVLRWQFTDPGGDTTQAASQVQVDDANDFATPLYDSTKVANTEEEFDLTGQHAVPASTTRWWRVRVWDGSDLVSDWSDPAEFSFVALPSLVLDNPPVGGTVEETTPPIAWTYGGVQSAVAIRLYEVLASGATVLLWRLPRLAYTDNAYTLPPKLLRQGRTYRVLVEVWDAVSSSRQWAPGAPNRTLVTRDFTYVRSGVPTGTTGLTAVVDGPAVLLTWQRTTMPDYFALVVGGELVEDRLDPDDLFVSGTTYSYRWWGARAGEERTYEVEAVVSAGAGLPYEHSDGNATDTARVEQYGIYLADPDDDTFVFLAGQVPEDSGIGESGVTHELPRRRAPVRITDGLRGYEGSVGGHLATAAERDTLMELKGRLKPLRLILGDRNFPVVLEEVACPQRPAPGAGYDATIGFRQVGEPWPMEVAGD